MLRYRTFNWLPLVGFLALASIWASASSAVGVDDALTVGDKAPDFELPIQGKDAFLSLSDLIKDGPVVVIVLRGYPGYQCSHCKRQLSSFINRSKALSMHLGDQPNRVILVYPGEAAGLQRQAQQFLGNRKLPEPLVMVRDPDMHMISEWGLRWEKRRETAYPATYVIGPGRRVKWAKVSTSHGVRASVEDVVRAIKDL